MFCSGSAWTDLVAFIDATAVDFAPEFSCDSSLLELLLLCRLVERLDSIDESIHTIMQGVFVNARTGTELTPKSFQRSTCGEEFDEYVYRAVDSPFPFSPVGAASRELHNLWKGRRFKIHYNDKWREGKVCSWRQYNPNDRCMVTKWTVEVELDTIEAGDKVQMIVTGTVCNNSNNEEGAIKVSCNDGDKMDVAIKRDDYDVKHCPRMKLQVNRLNVQGGGTLKLGEDDDMPLISLEWMEAASPFINLNEKVMSFDCPYCRAAEPVIAAFETPTLTRKAECPVCLETTECRVLECGHGVCHECWNGCRQAQTQVSFEFEEIDQVEMKKERAKRNRLFKKKRGRDDDTSSNFMATIHEMARAASDSVHFLQRLRWELMVENPAVWAAPDLFDHYKQWPVAVHKLFLQVIELRQDEMRFPVGGNMMDYAGDFSFIFCCSIADKLEEDGEYRAAVPWAELALFHAIHSEGRSNRTNVAAAYSFASDSHAKAESLRMSLKYHDAGVALCESAGTRSEARSREAIIREMREWTGSSGKLTSGI